MRALILAGGSGTRFWPLSRTKMPKQLVQLWGGKSMLRHTVERLLPLGEENIWVVAGSNLDSATMEASALPKSQHVFEPCARNTCAAIALGCNTLDPDEIVAIIPSDHYIRDNAAFLDTLRKAEEVARAGYIVTIGIEPTRPETGFGHIKKGLAVDGAFAVEAFVEKPPFPVAVEYTQSGEYLWNAGIFVFRVSTFFAELERQQPDMYAAFVAMRAEPTKLAELFAGVTNISIDYAVMERAQRIAVVPGNFGWSDVGHWAALDEVLEPDQDGNVVSENAVTIDTTNSIVFSNQDHRVVAVVGMDGVVVADTSEGILVIPRERAQDVRLVVERLKASGRHDLV